MPRIVFRDLPIGVQFFYQNTLYKKTKANYAIRVSTGKERYFAPTTTVEY